ncbi:hypothetical protein CDAR_272201 [Caerostris darwini]|uniref:Uncharacterized protein n=1 Tax=Caerostris darwini TaxID=1538125 RepID=A0AAV4UZJ2_9ARAC|nr:hypothetical protein CDAR_272201 [Caerostris darwini]
MKHFTIEVRPPLMKTRMQHHFRRSYLISRLPSNRRAELKGKISGEKWKKYITIWLRARITRIVYNFFIRIIERTGTSAHRCCTSLAMQSCLPVSVAPCNCHSASTCSAPSATRAVHVNKELPLAAEAVPSKRRSSRLVRG